MNLEKYTQKSQEAILNAQRLAQDYNHQAIEPTHLLRRLLPQLSLSCARRMALCRPWSPG